MAVRKISAPKTIASTLTKISKLQDAQRKLLALRKSPNMRANDLQNKPGIFFKRRRRLTAAQLDTGELPDMTFQRAPRANVVTRTPDVVVAEDYWTRPVMKFGKYAAAKRSREY